MHDNNQGAVAVQRYGDDFQRCLCGSEEFGRFEVYAYPPLFDGAKVRLPDSYRCAHCKRLGILKPERQPC